MNIPQLKEITRPNHDQAKYRVLIRALRLFDFQSLLYKPNPE
jgi:hypothetical protein